MKIIRKFDARASLLAGASLALAGLFASTGSAPAQSSFLWDGGDGSSLLWSTPGNWNPDGAPANSFAADFTFSGTLNPGSSGNPLNNDLSTGTISNLLWSAGAGSFYLGGNTFTNRGNWTNASGVAQYLSAGMVVGVNNFAATNTHFIDVGSGSLTLSGPVAAPASSATMVKSGPGTLYLTSPLTNTLGNGTPGGPTGFWVPGFGADEGTIIFDGGPTSVYNIAGEGVFGRNAPTGNRNVTAILQSGRLAGTTWIGIGRGNGTGDVLAELILNGSSVFNPGNWSGCFNSGDGAKRPRGSVTQNGTSLFWVSGTDNSAESAGSYLTHTLNDSATRQTGTTVQGQTTRANVGMAGRYVLKQTSPTARVTAGQMVFGTGAGGAGAFYNRGVFILYSPANINHFAIGNASGGATPANNSFGYYLHDSLTPVGLNEIGVGGSGGGDGVLEVRQGTVNITNWITLSRRDSAAAGALQHSLLLIRNGTVNGPNADNFRLGWAGATTEEYSVVDVGTGGRIGNLGPLLQLDLAQANNALNVGIATLGGGATAELRAIFGRTANPLTVLNLNGCTLSPVASVANFLGANLDGVYVHSGGVTFDTKGFDIATVPQLQAPMDQGVVSIPVATPGAGYIGRPIVSIKGGGGQGATAIAEWNEAAGTITGVTITCPGSGYFEVPVVTLAGGGSTNPATLGAPVLGGVTSGGLTKTGAGTLTLTGGASYTGPTVITGGTLSLSPSTVTPLTPGALTVSNAALTLALDGGFYSLGAGGLTLQNNATLNLNYGTLFGNPFTPAISSSGSLSAPGANLVINISGFGLQIGQFPIISYTGPSPANLANFSLGLLPPGVSASLVNNTANKTIDLDVTSTGQNLTWYGSPSDLWDINTSPNWNFGAAVYLEYGTPPNTVGDPVRFDDSLFNDFINPPATNINLATVLRPFTVVVDSSQYPYSFTGAGRLSGQGNLVKSNLASLTIGTSNDYTGGTFAYGGMLVISNNAGLGAPAGPATFSGGGLQVYGNLTSTRPFTINAETPFNVGPGLTALFGGTFSGASRVLLQDTGTASFTNRTRLQFHVNRGTLAFEGNAQITNTTSFSSVGQTTGDDARMIVRNNATFEISTDFNIADVNDARGRLDIQDNAIIRTLNLWLGKNNTCTGLVYQTGGIFTNHLTGGTDLRLGGNDANGTATFGGYYLSGGRMDIQKNFQIGAYGTGEMVISGGAYNHWTGTYPAVGRFTNGVGFLTVSGGQFNQLNPGSFLIIAENGTGTLTIGGSGVVTLTNALRLGGAGGNGTLNLNTGGRLIAPGVQLMDAGSGVATANLNGGTLQASANSGTFLQGLTTASLLAGGLTLDTAGFDVSVGQPLAGIGTLTKTGAGTVTLSGACAYTGPTIVNAGRLFVTPAFAGSGAVTVANNATLGVVLTTPATAVLSSLTLGSAGATSLDVSLGTNGNPVTAVLNAGVLAVNGTCSVQLAGRLSVGTFPLVKYTGALGGSGSFNPVVTGPQGMVASLSNHIAGSTLYVTIASLGPGIVWTGTNSAPALTNLWDLNSTTNWTVNGVPTSYVELVPPGDAVTFNDAGSGVVRLSNSASPASLLISNATVSYTFQGSGRIAGPTGLTKQGVATATMGLAGNDYIGDTAIQTGTLALGSGTAIPDGAGRGNVVISAAGTLDLNGNSETINGLAGTGALNNSGAAAVTLTVGAGNASSTWSGPANNAGAGGIALIKTGEGTLTVSGTNLLNNGAASQVNGGSLLVPAGGWLECTAAELWLGQGATTGSVVVAGGTVMVDNNWLAIGRNNAAGRGTLTVNSGKVVKAGNGNLVLGSLGGTGTIIVNGGEVLNNSMLWLGEGGTANGYLYLNGGLLQATQVRPNDNGGLPVESIAYFNGGTLQASGNSADFIQSTAWVQANGLALDDGGYTITLATVPLQEDFASPGGGLTKSGAGRVNLNTANTYSGLTRVTAGTLGGTGSVLGPVAVEAGGNFAPGEATTTVGAFMLTSQPLTLQGNATFNIRKNAGVPENTSVTGVGAVSYGGTLTINHLAADPLAIGDQFQLVTASASSGNFTSILGSAGDGLAYAFNPASGILSIIEGTASNPTNITYSVSGGTLTLTWPPSHLGWILEGQTNSLSVGISNNWGVVPGSSSVTTIAVPINPANPNVYFRLRRP
jgi:autotransporter-associated beta strand protein